MSLDKSKENMTAIMLWLTVIEEWKVNNLVNNKNVQVTSVGNLPVVQSCSSRV